MIVEIVKGRPHTWYFNKKGWRYEVEEDNSAGVVRYLVTETRDHFWQLLLSAEDVKVIEA